MPRTELLRELVRPHYVLNPRQLVRRAVLPARQSAGPRTVKLPWGEPLTCDSAENIGRLLVRRGVFDLLVCEVLLRLCDQGETAVDAGANIGQMTSVLATAVGPAGRVLAFEPHPHVFARLSENASRWTSASRVELHRTALSEDSGTASLTTDVFEGNQGSASLEPLATRRNPVNSHEVVTETLDAVLGDDGRVGLMKIDVEGHEIHTLRGARQALSEGRIRDIVFEERNVPPTPVTEFFREHGYTVLTIGERLRGPVLGPLGSVALGNREDASLLATTSPSRAVERLAPRGWSVYGVGPVARLRAGR